MIRGPVEAGLHPRNRFRAGYVFAALIAASPPLADFVAPHDYGDLSIDYANPAAVKALNQALVIRAPPQSMGQLRLWDYTHRLLLIPERWMRRSHCASSATPALGSAFATAVATAMTGAARLRRTNVPVQPKLGNAALMQKLKQPRAFDLTPIAVDI